MTVRGQMTDERVNWPEADWTWWKGKLVFECRMRLPGGLVLRHRPAEGSYLLDGQVIPRKQLHDAVTSRFRPGLGAR